MTSVLSFSCLLQIRARRSSADILSTILWSRFRAREPPWFRHLAECLHLLPMSVESKKRWLMPSRIAQCKPLCWLSLTTSAWQKIAGYAYRNLRAFWIAKLHNHCVARFRFKLLDQGHTGSWLNPSPVRAPTFSAEMLHYQQIHSAAVFGMFQVAI